MTMTSADARSSAMRYLSAREFAPSRVESVPSVMPSDATPSIDATKFTTT